MLKLSFYSILFKIIVIFTYRLKTIKQYIMEGYLESLGTINLKTGKSKDFNIYEAWGEDTTYEIHKANNGDFKIIATSGKNPLIKETEVGIYFSNQGNRFLFESKMVQYATGTDLKDLAEKYGNTLKGYTYK